MRIGKWIIAATLIALTAVVVAAASLMLHSTDPFVPDPKGETAWRRPGGARDLLHDQIIAGSVVVAAGKIDVEDGVVPLSVPANGQVAAVLVKDGDHVEKDAPLIRLDDTLADLTVKKGEAALSEAQVQLEQARSGLDEHASVVRQQEQAVAAAEARLLAQKRQIERLVKLRASSAVSEENYLSAADQGTELQAALAVDREKLRQLKQRDPRREIRRAEVAVQSAEIQLKGAREQLKRHTLLAPEAGTVLRVIPGVGQMLGADQRQPALWFCPDRPRIVRCEIEQEFVDRVKSGMKADIFDEIGVEPIASGVVKRTADWVAPRRTTFDLTFEELEVPTVEAIIELDKSRPAPRIGERVRVAIRLRNDEAAAASAR